MPTPIWTGSVTFGLVSIPIQLHRAVKPKDVRFHLLREEDQARVRQKYVCPPDEEEVAREDLVRGFEVAPDHYVTIDETELDVLAPLARRSIEITEFVDLAEIDPIYFERSYYLAPEEGADAEYRLLYDALKRTGKAGLGSFVLRTKEHLALIRPIGEALGLETLYFADEIVVAAELPGVPVKAPVGDRELRVAQSIIETMTGRFEPDEYRDEYREALLELINRKAQGQEIAREAVEPPEPGKVVNLMEALNASLSEARRRKKSA